MESDNLKKEWEDWIEDFKWYATASGLAEKPENVKVAMLMFTLGRRIKEIYNSLNLTAEEKGSMDLIIAKFQAHFVDDSNVDYQRQVFFEIRQLEGQNFNDFLPIRRSER